MSLKFLLWPFSLLFLLISYLRALFFQWGLFSQKKVDRPVLCVGNLTTGGTGKTPWVQKVSELLLQKSEPVAILSRGYSGDFSGVLEVGETMDPRTCGDEPLWLRKNTQCDVFVGKNRFQAAKFALSKKNYQSFILDDGFQHFAFKRDFNLILLDASAPKNHYHPLPVGMMRESFRALKRAHVVIINKCNYAQKEQISWLYEKAKAHLDASSIYLADFIFDQWTPLIESLNKDLDVKKVSLSCGVGNPQAFLKTLQEQNINPIKTFIEPDHYYWKPSDIEKMTYHMQQLKSHDLVITEKDAVKLIRYKKHFAEMSIQLWSCKMKIKIRENEQDLFKKIQSI